MPAKCWICETNDADSGEHVIKKSVLDFVMGKPTTTKKRYISRVNGKRNIGVGSFKNNNFKFKKSICKHCNNTLTQPYDDAFDGFIRKLFKAKSHVISRQIINMKSMCGSDSNQNNLALYLMKIFGCLIVENKFSINANDFKNIRDSLLNGTVQPTNIYLSLHRDLQKLSAKNGTLVAQFPSFSGIFTTWTIDLDWISLILSYPSNPPDKYGQSWNLSQPCKKLRLGKLT